MRLWRLDKGVDRRRGCCCFSCASYPRLLHLRRLSFSLSLRLSVSPSFRLFVSPSLRLSAPSVSSPRLIPTPHPPASSPRLIPLFMSPSLRLPVLLAQTSPWRRPYSTGPSAPTSPPCPRRAGPRAPKVAPGSPISHHNAPSRPYNAPHLALPITPTLPQGGPSPTAALSPGKRYGAGPGAHIQVGSGGEVPAGKVIYDMGENLAPGQGRQGAAKGRKKAPGGGPGRAAAALRQKVADAPGRAGAPVGAAGGRAKPPSAAGGGPSRAPSAPSAPTSARGAPAASALALAKKGPQKGPQEAPKNSRKKDDSAVDAEGGGRGRGGPSDKGGGLKLIPNYGQVNQGDEGKRALLARIVATSAYPYCPSLPRLCSTT